MAKIFGQWQFDIIFHFAAQTAVTISTSNATLDFESNAIGTFNLLKIMRKNNSYAKLIYSSTNKVYGNLRSRELIEEEYRYNFKDNAIGIDEKEPLDFYSMYGCSKGCADQYVRDFSRTYGLHTSIVRQSCIYGKHHDQCTEDQGWVAWFANSFVKNTPITIYGNGKQVRDILYISDLVDLYELIIEKGKQGEIYNAGGGMINSISLLELLTRLEEAFGAKVPLFFAEPRTGDQKIFISDNTKAEKKLGWTIKTNIKDGLGKLIEYLREA